MQCITPIWLVETSEQKGQSVPCGKCYNCLQSRRAVWTYRMMQENKEAESSYFITLTYDQENVPLTDRGRLTLQRDHLTNFLKNLRHKVTKYVKEDSRWFKTTPGGNLAPRLRYFACGEYGKKRDRPHFHIILWNYPDHFVNFDPIHSKLYSLQLEETWNKGIVDIGTVTQASCHYVAKYTLDPLLVSEYHEIQKPYAVMSRNPGIGLNFVDNETIRFYKANLNTYAVVEGGYKQPIGRYYTEKIYNDDVESLRAVRTKSQNYAYEQEEKKFKQKTGTRTEKEAILHWENFKRNERKETNKKIKSITKNSKL